MERPSHWSETPAMDSEKDWEQFFHIGVFLILGIDEGCGRVTVLRNGLRSAERRSTGRVTISV